MRFPQIAAVGILAIAVAAAGCIEKEFTEPRTLGGVEVPAEVLNLGKSTYMQYCRACHGVDGKGDGPAAKGLRPPPRDFTMGTYKFVAVESGYLPNDADFERIIRGGLEGTPMLPWDISDERLHAVIQYLKTFSDSWTSEYEEVGEPIVPGEDPWGPARKAEAIAYGKKVYHGLAQCIQCHPAYASFDEIYSAGQELAGYGRTDLTTAIYTPTLTDSDYDVRFQPPDFTFHHLRSGSTTQDLYRTIASGIGGTAMPTWKGSLPEDMLWAVTYYVQSLVEMRGTDQALAMKKGLLAQPEGWTPPAAKPASGKKK